MSSDEIYYRIWFDGQEIAICTLQWFDESDYDPKCWLNEETFSTKEEAIAFLKSKVLPENILLAIKSFLSVNDAFKYSDYKMSNEFDFDDLTTGINYEVYSSEDDSLIYAGKLVSVTQEGLRFENYFLPSKDYKIIYIAG